MAYKGFKDLTKKIASDKILPNKAFSLVKNRKHDQYQRGLASMVYKFSDEKTSGGAIKNENMSNKELEEELHKAVIKKVKKRKEESPFIDNIWGANLADM